MSRLKRYKDGAQTLRGLLLSGRLATPEEIADEWPGGKNNPQKNLDAWINCYAVLRGLARRVEFREKERDGKNAVKRAAVLAAISEEPETVDLAGKDEQGNHRTLTVYQKSDVALRVIHGLNVQLAYLVDSYSLLTKHGDIGDVELVDRVLQEQGYLQRVIAWVATTEGPGLPFGENEQSLTPPPHLATLHPLDFYSLAQAFQRVNVAGFAALESSTTPETRPDWSVFWSGLEHELKTPAPRLMRDRGLLSLVATASESARGRKEAYERAEQESKKKRAG